MSEAIKDDTGLIREHTDATKINTDEILSLVKKIHHEGLPVRHGKIEMWMEQMTVLSSFAETTYQGTVVSPSEFDDRAGSPAFSTSHEPDDDNLTRDGGIQDDGDSGQVSTQSLSVRLREPSPKSASPTEAARHNHQLPQLPSQVAGDYPPHDNPRPPPVSDVLHANVSATSLPSSEPSPARHQTLAVSNMPIPLAAGHHPRIEARSAVNALKPTEAPSWPGDRDNRPWVSQTAQLSQIAQISRSGIDDFAREVTAVVSVVRRDEVLIERSRRRREGLDANRANLLDSELLSICATPSRASESRIRELVLQGADANTWRGLDSDLGDDVRETALDVLINSGAPRDFVIELLNCGADPNAQGYQGLSFSPALTLAAYRGDEMLVWALCAAGAVVNPPDSRVLCPRCSPGSPGALFPHSYFTAAACSTPLLAALQFPRAAMMTPGAQAKWAGVRIRIVRFLLENGALANHIGCRKVSTGHRLHSALTLAASYWSYADKESQHAVLQALRLRGADVDYSFYPDGEPDQPYLAARAWPNARTYLWHLVERDHPKSLTLLLSSGLKLRPDLLGVLLVWAARHSAWECLRILATQINLAEVAILHKLVFCWADSIEVVRLSSPQLRGAIAILIRLGANPHASWQFSYWKTRSMLRKPVVKTESLSAVELVERIFTDESEATRRDLVNTMKEEAVKVLVN